ncbi:MAG: TPM domain-containing protein, partial [Candidatus Rokuibacteriota bacterium]
MNDYAGLLAPAQREQLERSLAEREQATGVQMVVAIFPSLEGEDLEDYSVRLAQRWRIGQEALDNGAILLVFVAERRVRLEVGYGLEPVIPDAVAGRIIRDAIAPRFREGRYADGIGAAVDAVFARIEGRDVPAPEKGEGRTGGLSPLWLLLGVFGVIAVVLLREVLSGRQRARRHGYTAGRRGWAAPAAVASAIWW